MTYQPVHTLQFLVSEVKQTPQTRCSAGVQIAGQAPQSPLYALAAVKTAADEVVKETEALQTLIEGYVVAEAGYQKARSALGAGLVAWDGSYDVYVAVGGKHCVTEDDAVGLALTVRGKTHNPFAMPLSVEPKYNPKRDWIRVHVHRAPGMDVVSLEYAVGPLGPTTTWKEADGCGAIHVFPNPEPGTYWFRAASRTTKAKSDYTTPTSVTVK